MLHAEEVHWRQRSRSTWIESGDKDFHQQASQRRRTNTILGLMDSERTWHTNESRQEEIVNAYFGYIFSSTNPPRIEEAIESISLVVSEDMNRKLIQKFDAIEVREALFPNASIKSVGPDGMSSFFFQKFWHNFGSNVVCADHQS